MKHLLALLIGTLLVLPACGPHYQRTQLPSVNEISYSPKVKNDITVAVHHMTRAEIHQTFGTRGRKLGYYGLCPIQLFIKNNTHNAVIFDPSKITLDYANHADVAYCLQNQTSRNTAGLVGLGLLATGIAFIYTLPFAAWYLITGITTAGLYVGLSTTTGMLVLTPTVAVYYAKKSQINNCTVAQDIKNIAVTHERIIAPGQELDVILFTKKENCKKEFQISLVNEATQESTTFNITYLRNIE